jgi:hypothetical protein
MAKRLGPQTPSLKVHRSLGFNPFASQKEILPSDLPSTQATKTLHRVSNVAHDTRFRSQASNFG